MNISYVALDRIFEQHMAKDKKAYKDAVAKGRGALLFGRKMTDDELLAKLRSFGVDMDRESFAEMRTRFVSAEELSNWLEQDRNLKLDDIRADWPWVCLTVLWERWFPEHPSFEMIDDAIQKGYTKAEAADAAGAVEIWLPVWKRIQAIMDSRGMKTVGKFDEKFRGSQSVFNWVQDLEMELHNAGLNDPEYCREQIRFCEEVIQRLPEDHELTIENMRKSIGAAYAQMEDTRKADDLFQEWLAADPQWGWGWIGWSNCYSFWKRKNFNLGRAEEILKQGLAVSEVRDKSDMLERLMNVYEDMGRKDDADRIQEELSREDDRPRDDDIQETTEVSVHDNVLSVKTKVNYGGMGMPLEEWDRSGIQPQQERRRKIGRNDPCPCGSGKKYKKCCLNSETIVAEENAMSKYRFETGSYGVPGGFLPSIACHIRNADGQWTFDYVLVRPERVCGEGASAALQAERDLSEAAQQGNAETMAMALRAKGYMLMDDFKVVG